LSQPAVIVVNSHVVTGSVGGRSSVFALERLGFPVWSLTTVSLGWHPGHGRSTRIAPDDAAFAAAAGDLGRAPGLAGVGAILIGYLGSAGQVAPLADLVRALKAANPAARFLYDPDIGDNDVLFVPEATASAARDRLLPLADIATPNRFELAWLTGRTLSSLDDVARAAAALGPHEVAVTSASVSGGEIASLLLAHGAPHVARQRAVAGTPKGTGDLFAAIYLAQRLNGVPATTALARAASAVGRLAAMAAAEHVDELPLAAGQDAFRSDGTDVAVTPLEAARGTRPA